MLAGPKTTNSYTVAMCTQPRRKLTLTDKETTNVLNSYFPNIEGKFVSKIKGNKHLSYNSIFLSHTDTYETHY